MKYGRHVIPIYNILLIVFPDIETASGIMTETDFSSGDFSAMTLFTPNPDTGIPCITITFKSVEYYNASEVIHESIHAAWDVLDAVGVKVSRSNHEALAYLADYIGGFVFEWMDSYVEEMENKKAPN